MDVDEELQDIQDSNEKKTKGSGWGLEPGTPSPCMYLCRSTIPVRSIVHEKNATTTGCFYPRSNHWEVGGRPQCDKCGCRVRNCSQHRFTTLETISNYRNSYPGFSSGRPRGTIPADDRYIVLQARRNRWQTAVEIARHTTQATGRPISRFTVARRLQGGGLFARRPVRCVPLTPAHQRRRSLWCRKHRNWRDNEWGRVLFTDESRFSLSSDSHRILIWRERGSRNHLSNIIERDRCAMGLQFLFMDDNAPCHRTVAAEQLLECEDIERMDWPARSPDLNPIEHVWDFLGRRLTARTSNDSGASIDAARQMGSNVSITH
ncbi:transposable element Tc1 transposase [Trichonephila clavipes]|nr:transposable element Tc1 transposase [Trichonephila clavipes]